MSTISRFWASHPECWIPITANQKAFADKLITETFYNYDYEGEDLAGRVIFLDQFQRHFQRHLGAEGISEDYIRRCREAAAEDVERNADELICQDEVGLVACLMPFKHLGRYTYIFDYLHNTYLPDMGWGPAGPEAERIKAYPILARFYYDTYRKWQTDEVVAAGLWSPPAAASWTYDAAAICESDDQPDVAALPDLVAAPELKEIVDALKSVKAPVVSLSGGIDSMVALAILKAIGAEPTAVHIIYGNRGTSSDEFAFVAAFCQHLATPLTVYEIPYIRRDSVDRDFYESATRAIRFAVYRLTATDRKVLLGHIRDDAVENIWTNFARGQHLHNLAKMEPNETQLGVNLWRPLLAIPKSQIYAAAAALQVPHLKNTTPSWCNRGKFREHFYAQTHAQYGPEVDDALLKVAATFKAQAALIDRLLYQKIYASWDPASRALNVGPALEANLDAGAWLQIFEHICHKYLHVNRPSIHAVGELKRRISANSQRAAPIKMATGKGLTIALQENTLTFILDAK